MQGIVHCEVCRYFADVQRVQGGHLRGTCKRHPVPVADKKAKDWCGDGESRDLLVTPGHNRRAM